MMENKVRLEVKTKADRKMGKLVLVILESQSLNLVPAVVNFKNPEPIEKSSLSSPLRVLVICYNAND